MHFELSSLFLWDWKICNALLTKWDLYKIYKRDDFDYPSSFTSVKSYPTKKKRSENDKDAVPNCKQSEKKIV